MFVKRAGELGARVLVLAANSDDTVQIGDVEKLITNRVDVLVIVPHDGTAMAKAVRMAHEAGIPVIAYDRIIRDSDLDLYVSFDNVHVGELQARYLVDHLPTPGKGRIVRIYGAKTDNNAAQFKRGPGPRARAADRARRHRGRCTRTGPRTGSPRTPSAS